MNAVSNGGVGDIDGTSRMNGRERGVDGVGDTLRSGARRSVRWYPDTDTPPTLSSQNASSRTRR